jgi:DNA-binding PadR family transcriptional regulator
MLLRYAILGLLDGQELHGYRIKSVFEEQVGSSWPLNFGQIYQTLKDLRRRGLIEGRFDRGTGHVGRWMYTITAKGRRALDTWLRRSPRRPQSVRDEILIRLLVLDRKEIDTRLGQLASQEQVYRDYVGQLTAERKLHDGGANGGGLLKALAADAAIYQAEAHLRWLAHSAKLLKRKVGAQALPARAAANGSGGGEPVFDTQKMKAAAR